MRKTYPRISGAIACLLCTWLLAFSTGADARLPRDRAEVSAFRAENACPASGLFRGACPGFEVDHVLALCAGGADKRENMQWLAKEDHRFKTAVDVRECRRYRQGLAPYPNGETASAN